MTSKTWISRAMGGALAAVARPKKYSWVLASVLGLSVTMTPSAGAQTTWIGLPGPGDVFYANTIPFGQPVVDRYQQLYLGALFGTNPILINALTFVSNYDAYDQVLAGGTYDLYLSTSDLSIGDLTDDLLVNGGPSMASPAHASLTLAQQFIGREHLLTFNLPTPYLYNPAAGNLFADFLISRTHNDPHPYNPAAYFAFSLSPDMNRAWESSDADVLEGGAEIGGLATGFDTSPVPVAVVPEPISLTLLATGLLGVGGVGLRRRRSRGIEA